ncbi:hypothetical protein [Fulvivirga sp. M361]|uniref:hypothetical protein n=1 Tax=Fulvivirga sp. M361 TaxID=2594266 RepID=UPI00162A06EB|nr:hypothetical protein [Fulvivirga sp. M361]
MELSTIDMIDQQMDYIHNPIKAGFVDDPAAWEWSSCMSYERQVEAKLEIVFIV